MNESLNAAGMQLSRAWLFQKKISRRMTRVLRVSSGDLDLTRDHHLEYLSTMNYNQTANASQGVGSFGGRREPVEYICGGKSVVLILPGTQR